VYHLNVTLDTAATNVAADEALLAAAEDGALPGEVLRLWESREPAIVQGRSSPDSEVRAAVCQADGVPVVRRASGGATVAIGPGCLMYAVVLALEQRPELRAIDRAHQFVLKRLAAACSSLVDGVQIAGTSDLVLADPGGRPPRKFSGNSLRVKRRHLLYHGTILYDFPLERIERWLGTPARQPKYRARREHGAFLTNLPAPRGELEAALIAAWNAEERFPVPRNEFPIGPPRQSASRVDASGLANNDP
jgi:lipoate-protein ligase A